MACVAMHVLPEAKGFELSLWMTLMTTRRVASAELSY
jgi:hypothetical protein